MRHFTWLAIVIIVAIVLSTGLMTQLESWSGDPFLYLCYFGLALLAFGLQIRSAGDRGASSMGFLFIIAALPRLNLKEETLIGFLALLFLAIRKPQTAEDKVEKLMRDLLGAGAAILACQFVYHTPILIRANVEEPVRLVLASLACFAANQFPVAIALLIGRPHDRMEAWRACAFWSIPYYLMGAAVGVLADFSQRYVSWQFTAAAGLFVLLLYHSLRTYTKRLARERELSSQMECLHLRTMEALATAIEAREQGQGAHLRRLQHFTTELGKKMGLKGADLEALRAAALLHDIGKLAIPEHITAKPGRLTPEEFDKIKIHPVIGAKILERAQFPYPVAPIVMSHHERWDGKGYPQGLSGETIPLAARVLAAVDALDSMTSPRPYRAAMTIEEAMAAIQRESGRAYDPKVVEILRKHLREWEADLVVAVDEKTLSTAQYPVPGQPLSSITTAQQQTLALYDLTRELGASLDLDQTFQSLCSRLRRLVSFESLVVWVERGDRLVALHASGEWAGRWNQAQMALGQGVSGWVAQSGEAVLNGDFGFELNRMVGGTSAQTGSGWVLATPLASGEVRGVLSLYRSVERFDSEQLRIMQVIAAKLSVAIDNGLRYRNVESSATTDYLTGLPNAAALYNHLASEIEMTRALESTLSVVVCDLDGFKSLNDRFGHLAGNEALREVGALLRSSLRDYDSAARIGGDEFVLVFAGMKPADLHGRLDRLREGVVQIGRMVCGEEVLNVSFGAASYPADGESAEVLLEQADRRMYADKKLQKVGFKQRRSNLLVLQTRRQAAG
jgi:diguanylate cyclase (GGDEF)-like protein/putative nucleotidyltransferase with HDIG domain